MNVYQATASITAHRQFAEDDLVNLAGRVFEAVTSKAKAVALGPVMTVDFNRPEIEVLFSVQAESVDHLHTVVAKVGDIIGDCANSFEYKGSTTTLLELVEREPMKGLVACQ